MQDSHLAGFLLLQDGAPFIRYNPGLVGMMQVSVGKKISAVTSSKNPSSIRYNKLHTGL